MDCHLLLALSRRLLYQGNLVRASWSTSTNNVPLHRRFLASSSSSSSSRAKKKVENENENSSTSNNDDDKQQPEGTEKSSSFPADVIENTVARRTSSSSNKLRERQRVSDVLAQKQLTPEQVVKEKRRYELDVPPVEEERHVYWKSRPERSINKNLVRIDFFEQIRDKSKDNFMGAIDVWMDRDVHLRGHVEFIYAALQQMPKFGVHRDLDAYKRIIDIFPKGRMIASNMFQVEFMHYPKQQQCGIDILEQMEHYGVCPDSEVQLMLTNIFGSESFPMRKAGRMLYWMPKFKNLSPWALPDPLPDDCFELAKLAIERITSIDLSTVVSVFQAEELQDSQDPTWIVSGQSPDQQDLIENLPKDRAIYVEGAFRVWLQRVCINYFVLRAEPKPKPIELTKDEIDDVSKLNTLFGEDGDISALQTVPTVHEQDDGVILAVCATGTSSRDSVVSWIRFLEKTNPRLGKDIPILFTLRSPIGPTDDLEIPTFEEAEKLKLISSVERSEEFTTGSGGRLGVDPRIPNLKQMGIWSESESAFPNWPHLHHQEDSISSKNLQENLKLVDELEEHVMQKKHRRRMLEEQEKKGKEGDPKQLT